MFKSCYIEYIGIKRIISNLQYKKQNLSLLDYFILTLHNEIIII